MGKFLTSLLISLGFFIVPPLIFAHNFGPIPPGGCPINHTPNTFINSCIHDEDAGIGKITPPSSIPTTKGDPSGFVAGLVSSGIQLLLIAGFVIALIWMILAGYSFIFAGGDEKAIASAWSRIYWGLIGMVIIVGAFAIIRLAEDFFNVKIISGEFKLPQRP